MLSTVSVTQFGARPNDSGDDTGAIRAAINASAPGDTVFFPAGSYNTSDQIFLKGGRTYAGENGSVINGNPSRHIFHIQEDNTRVDGLTLNGKPFIIDTPGGGAVSGLTLNNNVMHINATGGNNNGITFTTGLRNSTISNNVFDGGADTGLYGYYWNNLNVTNNEFTNDNEGIHVLDLGNSSQSLTIQQNYFSGIRRMGVEYQGGGSGTILQDNWYENPRLSNNFNDNNDSFAFSVIADRSNGMIVRRNAVLAPQRPDGVGVRIAFEVGGDNTLVEDNYISGINHVLAANDNNGSTSVTARNNFFENALQGPVGRGLTAYNNGSGVSLTWNTNRGKPGRNHVFGNTPITTNPPPTTPSDPSGATMLSDLNYKSAANGWGAPEKNHSNGELGPSDGRGLSIHGSSYSSGLGVHADSDVRYDLAGKFASFSTDLGVDDETSGRGSVLFQVYVDGRLSYDSGTMRGGDAAKQASVDVHGASELRLVVQAAGDGNAYDHADWAGAKLTA